MLSGGFAAWRQGRRPDVYATRLDGAPSSVSAEPVTERAPAIWADVAVAYERFDRSANNPRLGVRLALDADASFPDAGVEPAVDAGVDGGSDGGPPTVRPRFVSSPPLTAKCNTPYAYEAAVAQPPAVFTLDDAPVGAAVRSTRIEWTPAGAGLAHFKLRAVTAAGSDAQAWVVEVSCSSPPPRCGCGSASGLWALALAIFFLKRRRPCIAE